tara:strand:- start:902 stop:1294 length:393 start_codon:yes stop_codon:yes gene_type:complete
MDKIDQQIIESIISVVNPDTTERDQLVLEYLEGYFGNELNESTSDDDIMEAFAKLLETADAVIDFVDEGKVADVAKKVAKKVGNLLDTHPTNSRVNTALTGAEMQRQAKIRKFKKKHGEAFPEILKIPTQ